MTVPYCLHPRCSVLVVRGRCPAHAVRRVNFEVRKWYDLARWRHLRAQVLLEQAYACAACGRVQVALDVDHIVKHDGDPVKFWDRANLQALCAACHTLKTRRGE